MVQLDAWLQIRTQGGGHVKQRYMLSVMCGRSTYKLTWEEIVWLYQLTLEQPAVNTQARYNVCPTTTIDTIVGLNGKRGLVPMRWGLVPSWWSKPLKELKLATFNACAALERGHRHISRPNKKAPPRSSARPAFQR